MIPTTFTALSLLRLLVLLNIPTLTKADLHPVGPELFYAIPPSFPDYEGIFAVSQPQEPEAFPICGGARVVDSTAPFEACQDLIRGGLLGADPAARPQAPTPHHPTPLNWDSDPPRVTTAFNASDPAAAWPAHLANITAPVTWQRGRCSITVDWVLGRRPRGRRIVRSLLSMGFIASNLAFACVSSQHRTQGSWKIRSIPGRGQGLDELRVTVAINAGDDVIRDAMLESQKPAGMTEQQWNWSKVLKAQSDYYYGNHSRLYP